MDQETRGALERLDEHMQAGFARTEAGFARMDRFVELQQAQHQDHVRLTAAGFDAVERRFDRVEADVQSLQAGVQSLQKDMQSLRAEFASFRDWVTSQLAELRTWLRELTR